MLCYDIKYLFLRFVLLKDTAKFELVPWPLCLGEFGLWVFIAHGNVDMVFRGLDAFIAVISGSYTSINQNLGHDLLYQWFLWFCTLLEQTL